MKVLRLQDHLIGMQLVVAEHRTNGALSPADSGCEDRSEAASSAAVLPIVWQRGPGLDPEGREQGLWSTEPASVRPMVASALLVEATACVRVGRLKEGAVKIEDVELSDWLSARADGHLFRCCGGCVCGNRVAVGRWGGEWWWW